MIRAGFRSWFRCAFPPDRSVHLHHGIVEGPTANRAYVVEAGKDARKAAVRRNLLECGIELLAEPVKAAGIHLAQMDLVPVDLQPRSR